MHWRTRGTLGGQLIYGAAELANRETLYTLLVNISESRVVEYP